MLIKKAVKALKNLFFTKAFNYADFLQNAINKKKNNKYLSRAEIICRMHEKIRNGEQLTDFDYFQLVQCINVSKLSGKLDGFYSISTSVLKNPICHARACNNKTICSKCYAATSTAYRTELALALDTNYDILNGFLIPESAWSALPIYSSNGKSRIESHGDIATVTGARNYLRIIKTHKHLFFGVWSKNWNIWLTAFKLEGKPENMNFILSSEIINKVSEVPEKIKPYVDKVFTVYDKDYIKENGIDINCGGRSCKTCLKCYEKENPIFHISEQLK